MESKVIINEKEIGLKMSAAIPRIYRQKHNEDIIVAMNAMQERLMSLPLKERAFNADEENMLETLAHACHKHADPNQPDDVVEWLSQFEVSELDKILFEIIKLWNEDNVQLSTAKKKTEEQ